MRIRMCCTRSSVLKSKPLSGKSIAKGSSPAHWSAGKDVRDSSLRIDNPHVLEKADLFVEVGFFLRKPADWFSWRILKMANFLPTFANNFYLCIQIVKPFTI